VGEVTEFSGFGRRERERTIKEGTRGFPGEEGEPKESSKLKKGGTEKKKMVRKSTNPKKGKENKKRERKGAQDTEKRRLARLGAEGGEKEEGGVRRDNLVPRAQKGKIPEKG